jgi:hypothetical protein
MWLPSRKEYYLFSSRRLHRTDIAIGELKF